ncbi:MAG: hypothetical protein ACLPKI_05970 [Streptosporangiaceae bacterium]
MTSRPPAQRAAEYLIGRACRHLPAGTGDERGREWAAELPAILHDPDVRPALLRSARVLRFAAGTIRTARRDHGVFRGRLTTTDARAAGARLFLCFGLWLAAVCLVRLGATLGIPAPHGIWTALVVLAAAVTDLFAAAQIIKLVRWLCQHDD